MEMENMIVNTAVCILLGSLKVLLSELQDVSNICSAQYDNSIH